MEIANQLMGCYCWILLLLSITCSGGVHVLVPQPFHFRSASQYFVSLRTPLPQRTGVRFGRVASTSSSCSRLFAKSPSLVARPKRKKQNSLLGSEVKWLGNMGENLPSAARQVRQADSPKANRIKEEDRMSDFLQLATFRRRAKSES